MILEAALRVPRFGTLDLGHLDHGVPGEFGQRLLAGRLPLPFCGNDNPTLARGTADLSSGQAGLAFEMLTTINAGELEVRFHIVCPLLTQNRARITQNRSVENPDPGRQGSRPARRAARIPTPARTECAALPCNCRLIQRRHQRTNLVLQVRRIFHGMSHLVAHQLAVVLAQPVYRRRDSPRVHLQLSPLPRVLALSGLT